MKVTSGDTVTEFDSTPMAESLQSLIARTQTELSRASLSQLMSLFDKIIGKPIVAIVGDEAARDLDALAAIRNTVAHGRDFYVEFEIEGEGTFLGKLDKNPMQKPISRLKELAIIGPEPVTGMNHNEIFGLVFSDSALRHFHSTVRAIEKRLHEAVNYPKSLWVFAALQELPSDESGCTTSV